jgi:DNA repair protein RadA/Sms
MSIKKIYECTSCNFSNPKWLGKCPNCSAWNSFVEKIVENKNPSKTKNSQPSPHILAGNRIQSLEELYSQKTIEKQIYNFSAAILNDFFSEGLMVGSFTLLAGEPGLGKSTLALQLLRSLEQKNTNIECLYITAEESVLELARRSKRLNIPKSISVLQANNFEHIEDILQKYKPKVVILDSIQTIFSTEIAGSPGSPSQVSFMASQFMAIIKNLNISLIMIGHVTKDGNIAGPKTLEHLVDTVVSLEMSKNTQYRTLSLSKHRYGSTDKQLLLKMGENGLEIITDPSLALLENLEIGIGVVYGLALDKNLPMVVEIQALVGQNFNGNNFFGRRETIGITQSKLNTILAVIEKYLKLDLKSRDVYIQVLGLPKNLQDDSLDLPILLAILSSLKELPISEILKFKAEEKKLPIFSARLTLSGKLRNPTFLEIREKTAGNLGFIWNKNIKYGELKEAF